MIARENQEILRFRFLRIPGQKIILHLWTNPAAPTVLPDDPTVPQSKQTAILGILRTMVVGRDFRGLRQSHPGFQVVKFMGAVPKPASSQAAVRGYLSIAFHEGNLFSGGAVQDQ